MQLSDFYYELPPDLIASHPLSERTDSRLMYVDSNQSALSHHSFKDLKHFLKKGDLLVCNNSRVLPARLWGQKETGGKVELLLERIVTNEIILAHLKTSHAPKVGSKLLFKNEICFEVIGRRNALFELKCLDPCPVLEIFEAIGEIPLPPYLNRSPRENDRERYQTIYAKDKGSVAAPTAGLHFNEDLLNELVGLGVDITYLTLHVGAGTFLPVRVDDITQHQMHSEWLTVSEDVCEKVKKAKEAGGRVIAVGTTSVRGLETATQKGELKPYVGETSLFIYPGYQFQCVDALITNFHLPESSLLMLVSAFAGYHVVMKAYKTAIDAGYRFFSYGDAMFVVKNQDNVISE